MFSVLKNETLPNSIDRYTETVEAVEPVLD